MPISSVSIDNVDATPSTVTVDWTAEGLIFSGTTAITGFVEVIDGGFTVDILASTPIDVSQGRDTASYSTDIDVSAVSAGDYTVRVSWDDDSGNSGQSTASVTIPDSGGGGGGGDGAISSVSIDNTQADANTVTVDWTAEGLIFSGVVDITGFVEVVGSGFNPTILASTPIDVTQGRDTASYTTGVDVSSVSPGDYTVRVNWDDDSGNSGRPSTSVTIPESGGGGGGFTLGDITLNCSVPTGTATEGDVVEATADLEAVAPSAYSVDVDLYINGDFQKSKTASISTGGAGSVRFFVGLPQTGEYNIAVELSNLRQA